MGAMMEDALTRYNVALLNATTETVAALVSMLERVRAERDEARKMCEDYHALYLRTMGMEEDLPWHRGEP